MKKGLLKLLSAVMAISMLLCMSMVAFAATPITVTTEYDKTNVTVTAEVAATNGEQVAFLVEQDNDIIWIDQQTAANGKASTTFVDLKNDVVGATIKVGTTSLAASNFEETTIALDEYTVSWEEDKPAGSETKVVGYVVSDDEDVDDVAVTKGNKVEDETVVTFYYAAAKGEKLVSITKNGANYNFIANETDKSVDVAISEDTTLVFKFEAVAATGAVTATVASSNVVKADSTTKLAAVPGNAVNADDYGILVAIKNGEEDPFKDIKTPADVATLKTDEGAIRKYHALGATNEGNFIVKLNGEGTTFFDGNVKYVACVYAAGESLQKSANFDLN